MDLIIFHQGCTDGFCAAYVAHQRWPEAELLAQDYGVEPPYDKVKDKDVIVVDFSWNKREHNEQLARLAHSFRILDHHKTAQAVLEGLDFAIFDTNRSGAGLAWDYIFGKDSEFSEVSTSPMGRPRPWFVDYAEDYDLWKFQLLDSRAINAYLAAVPKDIHSWDEMVARTSPEQAAVSGAGSRRQIESYVRQGKREAQSGRLFFVDEEGFVHEYWAMVISALGINSSELGGELADFQGIDVAIVWFERGDGKIQFMLRAHHGADAGKLAKAKGGGGHKQSAGFELSITEGRELIDAILNRPLGGESAKVFYAPMVTKNKLDKTPRIG
jgi:oligoribonuclease NrnB/cAMP/cGMP phosphodiesterase (DHH superfamily)